MFKLLIPIVVATFSVSNCQHFGGNPPSGNPQASARQFGFDTTTPRPGPLHPPAQVHYVNIGPQLQGDYKFGYDTGKGPMGQSFREEVRQPDGTVKGAYGYIDGAGKMRIVKYTAGKDGFKVDGDTAPDLNQAAPRPAPQPQSHFQPPPQPRPSYSRPQTQFSAIPPEHNRQVIYNRPPTPSYQSEPPSRSFGPPPLPQHALEQLQAFNRPPPSPSSFRPSAPAQPAPSFRPSPNFGINSNKIEETTTWGPPVIPVELLAYNIGVRNG